MDLAREQAVPAHPSAAKQPLWCQSLLFYPAPTQSWTAQSMTSGALRTINRKAPSHHDQHRHPDVVLVLPGLELRELRADQRTSRTMPSRDALERVLEALSIEPSAVTA